MGSLIYNFIKRAIVVPAIIMGIIIAAIYFTVPNMVKQSNRESVAVSETIDLSEYETKNYSSFSELKNDDYVGSIQCSDINLSERAVVYNAENKNNISVISASKEPWKNGGVLVVGANTVNQLKSLHNVQKGDEFDFNFYSNKKYTYKLKKIISSAQEKDLKKYIKEKTLVIAVPFVDFSNADASSFYTVYIAETK